MQALGCCLIKLTGGRGRHATDCVCVSDLDPCGCLQVGASLCNFLTVNATFHHQPASGSHAAEVLLQFGSPGQLSRGGCSPPDDVAAGDFAFTWPLLAGIDVLGWHLPAEAVTLEVVLRTDNCGGLAVVRRLELLPPDATSATPGGLRLDLAALGHALECPYGLRLTWLAPGLISAA